ncbi:Putative amidase domain-containing protein [Mesobacillus persicus]|uniref:Putative amidase domain-containing protein n=1 Tax=Mesobacillus persicus TaxID=930146 RepID=A0A1H8DRE2_9BACI|nr:amidase domain-containing protein [Mesobacillus persicus]SEN09735.1 Putative amidase domain-containing protein [Mesobacillus persicus]
MREQLQNLLQQRVRQYVSQTRSELHDCPLIEKTKESCARRGAEIVRTTAEGKITGEKENNEGTEVFYTVHFKYLIKQKHEFIIEERVEERKAEFYKGVLVDDEEFDIEILRTPEAESLGERVTDIFERTADESEQRTSFQYDRLKAVQYAERWWNDYNPAYKKFEVDCTNYISQCLHAGGAPMQGYSDRAKGWWMRNNNWSYSWSVANSMRWYLPGSNVGLKAKEVSNPSQLSPGDVICYDFQGDGRFDHTTIVTAKDADGMPLVNAHTTNSRKRYWAYEDSTAYTPDIKYKFFTVVDDQ